MPVLLDLLPQDLRQCVAQVSVQDLVKEIEKTGNSGWIGDFKEKYAL